MGIGRLNTPILVPGRVQDLGHERVRNIGTRIAGTQRRNSHAQSQKQIGTVWSRWYQLSGVLARL